MLENEIAQQILKEVEKYQGVPPQEPSDVTAEVIMREHNISKTTAFATMKQMAKDIDGLEFMIVRTKNGRRKRVLRRVPQ